MRTKLVELLDHIGVNRFIDRPTTAGLWSKDQDLVHFTSCLRYPVFVDGKNYSGQPAILKTPFLKAELERWLVEEMRALPKAVWVALGDHAGKAAPYAAQIAGLDPDRLIVGLPHPSGQNVERINYFLGRGRPDGPSKKTNTARMDAARERIIGQIARLIAEAEASGLLAAGA
jgi:hypothetical protein